MADSEMVERVARAIWYEQDIPNGPIHGDDWMAFRTHARAAIAAMRTPTRAMVESVRNQWGSRLEANWHAMVDAALDAGEGGE